MNGATQEMQAGLAKQVKQAKAAAPTYRVYVIDLDPAVLDHPKFRKANPAYVAGKPCVYVGSTAHTAEQRFERHKCGHRANAYARSFGLRLRSRSYTGTGPFATRAEAEAAEAGLAVRLRERGYAVWSN